MTTLGFVWTSLAAMWLGRFLFWLGLNVLLMVQTILVYDLFKGQNLLEMTGVRWWIGGL